MSLAISHESPKTAFREPRAEGIKSRNIRGTAGNPLWRKLTIPGRIREPGLWENGGGAYPEIGGGIRAESWPGKNGIFLKSGLTVGPPDDPFEREADRVADKVMAMPDSKVRRKPS